MKTGEKTKNPKLGSDLFKLPNHQWVSLRSAKSSGRWREPEYVVRKKEKLVLIRVKTLEELYSDYSEERTGKNNPNIKWEPDRVYVAGLAAIKILAQRGTAEDLKRLAILMDQGTALLNEKCKANPQLIHQYSKYVRSWPLLVGKNQAAISNDQKALFSAIQLAESDYIEMDPQTARWKTDAAREVALNLLAHVRRVREGGQAEYFFGGKSIQLKRKLTKDFNDQNADEWWSEAKKIFLCSYPDPQLIKELVLILPEGQQNESPGRVKQRILEILKRRFSSLAPNRLYHT